jgi:hypothetical protein
MTGHSAFDNPPVHRQNATIDRCHPTPNSNKRCVLNVRAFAIRTLGFVGMILCVAWLDPVGLGAADKKDKVPGKLWEYSVTKGGKEIESGKFRATEDLKLYHSGNQIGTYTKEGKGEFELEITRGELKGTIHLKVIQKKPRRTYAGEWEMASGGRAKIEVRFLGD